MKKMIYVHRLTNNKRISDIRILPFSSEVDEVATGFYSEAAFTDDRHGTTEKLLKEIINNLIWAIE